ncbi:hypothetical protein [Methylobacterium dankookense]|uniref:Ig-like domain-containing protein n=1 Tax=Methylobacterium dankookense TaxID=560405 RepID=A0A564FWT2_9HYPH|nr:hypothetical protein [Methylobacterium dankookense]GJD59170.1 hypothetical protein IFDJLNFL_5097 [Methylobacterium dankookense]VUF12457.1 hypothetical protein MTDSW087_02149 [Methylobacterium dankookense]
MRRFVSALLLGLTASASFAQGRPIAVPPSATQRLVCAEAMALVKREGEVTLPTGRGATERLVRDRSFCDFSEVAELRFLPTRDNPQCPVGYRCREPGFEEWNW